MAPTQLGLLGHNGLVGKQVLDLLVPLHQAGKIHLTVIHRSSAKVDSIPSDIPKKVLDIGSPDGPAYDQAIMGLQVILSIVGSEGLPLQTSLIPAFQRSQDLVTFIPSELGCDWDDDEVAGTKVGFLKAKDTIADKLREANIPLTIVKAGFFSDFAIPLPISNLDVKANKINVYGDSKKTEITWVSTPYLARGLVELVQKPPTELVNKTYDIIEEYVTQATIIDLLTELHGKPTEEVVFDDAKFQQVLTHDNVFVQFSAIVLRKIKENRFNYHGEKVTVPGWKANGVEKTIRDIFAK